MASAKDVPVPGRPMDLELSDGEGVEEIRPPKTKRKDDGGGGVPSPVKRGAADQEMVSMSALKAVLAEQTRDIKDGIKTDIQAAIHATETKFEKALEGVRAGIQGQMARDRESMQDVKKGQAELLTRIEALEQGQLRHGPGGAVTQDRKPTLIWGGWREDTKRHVILKDLQDALADVGVKDKLDNQPWVPAVRHSIALSEVMPRSDETEATMRLRMLAVVDAINSGAIHTENLKPNSKLWCAISRPRQDRGNGVHAGKVRKMLHMAGVGMQDVDCSYRDGTVWVGDHVVASVVKPRPQGEVLEGKIAGSWVDINALAKLVDRPKASLGEVLGEHYPHVGELT